MGIFKKANEEAREELHLSSISNTIGKGTEINGSVDTQGNIRIDGKVKGNVRSKSKIVLGKGSYIEGNIWAQNAEIEGEVIGNVDIAETLTLKASASIKGDIKSKQLITEAGAQFYGQCHIGDRTTSNTANLEREGKGTKSITATNV